MVVCGRFVISGWNEPGSWDKTPMTKRHHSKPYTKNTLPNPKTPTPNTKVSGISYIGVLSVASL